MSELRVVAFGDSITAGQYVSPELTWPHLIGAKNLGVSNDTTEGGLNRFYQVAQEKPDIVLLQFCYNDCNRWASLGNQQRVRISKFYRNLMEMVTLCHKLGVQRTVLIGAHPVRGTLLYREELSQYSTEVWCVARDRKCSFANMGSLPEEHLMEDGLHLAPSGHEWYAKRMRPFTSLEGMF